MTMSLCRMPMAGRWTKEKEEWTSIGESEVHSEQVDLVDRQMIEEQTRKRFQVSKKVYDVPIPKYHTHTRLKEEINLLTTEFSELAVQYSIGKSVNGKDLICLKITEGATKERQLLKPQVKYIANIHGDEVVGRELLLALARALCEQYGHDAAITNLLQTVEIHLLPSMNPDGYILKTRNNANDKDLNRGFPDWCHLETDQSQRLDSREPEVSAVMNWVSMNSFLLSLSFHDGWSMVIFPWDDSPACTPTDNAVCSEDSTFYALAQVYACNHKFMHTGHCPCHSEALPIGNYRDEEIEVVEGGMQDYNYMFSNCMELTVEVSCDKKPPAKSLPSQWINNYQSMLSVLHSVDGGVKGQVLDAAGTPLAGAKVRIEGIDKEIVATEHGEYWRLLLPGTYTLMAISESSFGVLESEPTIVTITHNLGEGATIVNLVARMKVPGCFLVSSYQAGEKETVKSKGEIVLLDLFSGCEKGKTEVLKNDAHTQAGVTVCHIVFRVEVVFNTKSLVQYFNERWGEERIMRPTCSREQMKLTRRLNIFFEDTFCEEKFLSSGWSVTLDQ